MPGASAAEAATQLRLHGCGQFSAKACGCWKTHSPETGRKHFAL